MAIFVQYNGLKTQQESIHYHINLRKSEKNIKELAITNFSSQKILTKLINSMSGDNLHGKQPIKFYSEKITLTKVELLERQLSLGEKVSDLDEKHKEWSRKLSG